MNLGMNDNTMKCHYYYYVIIVYYYHVLYLLCETNFPTGSNKVFLSYLILSSVSGGRAPQM